MALEIFGPPSAAEEQRRNHNSGGSWLKTVTYTPPAGTHWAVIGLLLSPFVDESDEDDLAAAVLGQAGIVSVENTRLWGPTPSAIDVGDEPVLHVVVDTRGQDPTGSGFHNNESTSVKPPANQPWILLNCVMAGAFPSAAAIAQLQDDLETVTGVNVAKVLVNDQVPPLATSVVMRVTAHLRMDRIPEEA